MCIEAKWPLFLRPGIVDRVDYVPGSGRQLLAKNSSLELCDEAACKPTKVTVTVKLEVTEDSSNKCEVDADSIAARNEFCGTSSSSCIVFVNVLSVRAVYTRVSRCLHWDNEACYTPS